MRIAYIVPGVGDTFYCQTCIRNLDMMRELRARNHTITGVPMYLPVNSGDPGDVDIPIFFGAISVYLKEKLPSIGELPVWARQCLDNRSLLTWISQRTGATEPAGLEEMTISVMLGDEGKHKAELDRLIAWLKNEVKPDVVHLSTALLIGIGEKIKQELRIPVFSTIQDENIWLDNMKQPYPDQAWEIIRRGTERINGLISPSIYFAEFVQARAGVPSERIHVVPTGIFLPRYQRRKPNTTTPVIGFLSRISPLLGADVLCKAFFHMKKDSRFSDAKLKLFGGIAPQDRPFIRRLRRQIAKKGYEHYVQIETQFKLDYVKEFFDDLSILSVPAPDGEAFGMFLLEAMASGIPVIQPDKGAYPEIINTTGGGIVYREHTAAGLADAMKEVLLSPKTLNKFSESGYTAVHEAFSIERMADKLLQVYKC